MARKITLTGKNARYIEHRGADATPDDDREIRMEGDDAQYEEHAYGSTESPMQQQKQYDLTEMTSAVDRVRQFFWSESAMAFIFCVNSLASAAFDTKDALSCSISLLVSAALTALVCPCINVHNASTGDTSTCGYVVVIIMLISHIFACKITNKYQNTKTFRYLYFFLNTNRTNYTNVFFR